jgi:hypothetical protein
MAPDFQSLEGSGSGTFVGGWNGRHCGFDFDLRCRRAVPRLLLRGALQRHGQSLGYGSSAQDRFRAAVRQPIRRYMEAVFAYRSTPPPTTPAGGLHHIGTTTAQQHLWRVLQQHNLEREASSHTSTRFVLVMAGSQCSTCTALWFGKI